LKAPILITGGAQRLGLAVAEHLLSAGYSVIITYRNKKPSVDALHAKGVTVIQADFATQNGIEEAIADIKSVSVNLRGIIHNASDWDQETPDTNPGELMHKMMQIHASAPYQLNLALEAALLKNEGVADIIHMTDYVQTTGSKKHIAYAASKAALHNLTLSFATKLAPKVKVNSIAPALVMFNDGDSEEYKAKALKKSLLEVCPGAQEAVNAVMYLLNSDYITGQTLHLDGGRHLK
jgi:dihydromonapterin reductase/dihydrofolate reductase